MKIAILGVHCSGKSTIAKLLSQHLSIPFISTDPIGIVRKMRYSLKVWRTIVSAELFPLLSYAFTRAVFSKYSSFITDYDLALQLAYAEEAETRKRVLQLLEKLPKYDIVIILRVKDPITILWRALERARWGNVMLSASWQRKYYDNTVKVIKMFEENIETIRIRGRKVIEVEVEKEVNDVMHEILSQL